MGERGPAPTPTPMLKLAGTHRPGRTRGEPRARKGRPTRPIWLKGAALRRWKECVRELEGMGCLATCDGPALVRYCTLWGMWSDAVQRVEASRPRLPGMEGVNAPAPARGDVKTILELSAALSRFEKEFGFTPSARTRIDAGATRPSTEGGGGTLGSYSGLGA